MSCVHHAAIPRKIAREAIARISDAERRSDLIV